MAYLGKQWTKALWGLTQIPSMRGNERGEKERRRRRKREVSLRELTPMSKGKDNGKLTGDSFPTSFLRSFSCVSGRGGLTLDKKAYHDCQPTR